MHAEGRVSDDAVLATTPGGPNGPAVGTNPVLFPSSCAFTESVRFSTNVARAGGSPNIRPGAGAGRHLLPVHCRLSVPVPELLGGFFEGFEILQELLPGDRTGGQFLEAGLVLLGHLRHREQAFGEPVGPA
jgi:hypothetical protein